MAPTAPAARLEKELTGKVPRDAIRLPEIPRYSDEILNGFRGIGDLTSTVSDAMDEIGLAGVVPARSISGGDSDGREAPRVLATLCRARRRQSRI